MHCAIIGHALYTPRVVLLCTRACAKPWCIMITKAPPWSLACGHSILWERCHRVGRCLLCIHRSNGIFSLEKQQQRPHLLKDQLQHNANVDLNAWHGSLTQPTAHQEPRSCQCETHSHKPSRGTCTWAAGPGVQP